LLEIRDRAGARASEERLVLRVHREDPPTEPALHQLHEPLVADPTRTRARADHRHRPRLERALERRPGLRLLHARGAHAGKATCRRTTPGRAWPAGRPATPGCR